MSFQLVCVLHAITDLVCDTYHKRSWGTIQFAQNITLPKDDATTIATIIGPESVEQCNRMELLTEMIASKLGIPAFYLGRGSPKCGFSVGDDSICFVQTEQLGLKDVKLVVPPSEEFQEESLVKAK